MNKEETLQRIKETEEQVRRTKAGALEEKEKILREARMQGFELRESLRGRAEKRQTEILTASEASIVREKDALLAKGRQEADALRSEAHANVERAVDRLIEKFKGALNA
jgi:V/A-type H+-transporting ATPase subunit G/H